MPASFHWFDYTHHKYAQDKLKGFTLVELLVVISIIAILSVIGVTVFSGVQKGARDAKRKSDIDAIAKAMEVNKNTAGNYSAIQGSQFSSGSIPQDPRAGQYGCGKDATGEQASNDLERTCWYCGSSTSGTTHGYCNNTTRQGSASSEGGFDNVGFWIICANLETGNPAYYCRKSTQ